MHSSSAGLEEDDEDEDDDDSGDDFDEELDDCGDDDEDEDSDSEDELTAGQTGSEPVPHTTRICSRDSSPHLYVMYTHGQLSELVLGKD